MAKMKKIMKSPLSKRKQDGSATLNSPKTFGVSLEELVQRNSENSEIPYVLERITEYIVCYGVKHEGIFRVNGNAKVMERLKLDFDKIGDADLENSGDIMSVAGLMKMFLRELPKPLIPTHFKEAFMQVHKEFYSDRSECCDRMRNLVKELPEANRRLLKFLCRFLVHISLNKEANKMSPNALAIVFAPNLFRCSDGVEGFREQSVGNSIVLLFIEEYNAIFKDEHEEAPTLSNFIQVKEAIRENKFSNPPAMPIPYEHHKKQRKSRQETSTFSEPPELIKPYAEYRLGQNDELILGEEPRSRMENHIYASVSKAQRDSILSATCEHVSYETEPYIRSNSPSWHKPNCEPSSPKLGSSPKTRKEYMEEAIKESIKEHLFGNNFTSTSEESDKWDSPGEEAPPVPPKLPELLALEDNNTRTQKRRKRRGSKTAQDPTSTSQDETDAGAVNEETQREVKSDQELEQCVVTSSKRAHRTRPVEMDQRQPLMINVVDFDSPQKSLTRGGRSSSFDNELLELQEMDLSAIGYSEVLSCLTLHRAPPPRKRRPPSLHNRKAQKTDVKHSDSEVKVDLKQLPRKPPSPPPRPNLSPSNSISPSVASKLERRKQVRSMPEIARSAVDREFECDSEGKSSDSNSPPTSEFLGSNFRPKKSESIPIIPPLDLYKLGERSEDDPMVSPRERSGFDDAMISPRSRRTNVNIRGFASECPPSPPGLHENRFWHDKRTSISPKGEPTMKELTKKAKSLRKKIKEFEEKFAEEKGYKPTQAQDRQPIKRYLMELSRTHKLIQEMKENKSQGDRTSSEFLTQNSPFGKGSEPLFTTAPTTVEQSLETSLRKLREKRETNGRPENVDEMNIDQLRDEKFAVQKALLHHENAFGRPKDFSESLPDTNSTAETEKRHQSPERPSELELNSVSRDDTLSSLTAEEIPRLTQSLPTRTSKNLLDHEVSPVSPLTISVDGPAGDCTINVPDTEDGEHVHGTPSNAAQSLLTTKDSDAILHQASTSELLEQQASALKRKKKLRKKLKAFEDNFAKKTGRKVQKEDRGSHEEDYEEYKKIKARLRLLDALITKQRAHNSI